MEEEDELPILTKKTTNGTDPKTEEGLPILKKKEEPAPATPSVGVSASAEVGEPSGQSTEKPTPTLRLKERIGSFVSATQNTFNKEAEDKRAELQAIVNADPTKAEQANADYKAFLAEREKVHNATLDKWMGIYSEQFEKEETEFQKEAAKADFEKNKVTNPITSLARTAWTTLSDDLPSQAYATRALGTRLGSKIDEFGNEQLERLGVNDFLEAAGLLKPVGKDVKKQVTDHLMLNDIRAAIENSKASAEAKKHLVNSLDKIKGGDFVDWMNYAASAIGQGVAQIPLSVASRGLSSVVQQTGSIYLESVQQIARENNMTVEEVIKSEKDSVLYPLLFGVGTGMLDAIGAKGVAGAVTKKQVMNSFRARALGVLAASGKGAGIEAGTEAFQGALEQIGIKKAAGETWEQALSKFDWSQVVEGAVQGGIAGMFLGGSGKALSNTFESIAAKPDIPTVVAEAKASINPTNEASVEAAATKIEEAIDESGAYHFDKPVNMAKPDTETTVPVDTQIKPSPVTQTDENSGTYSFGKNLEPGTPEEGSGTGEAVSSGVETEGTELQRTTVQQQPDSGGFPETGTPSGESGVSGVEETGGEVLQEPEQQAIVKRIDALDESVGQPATNRALKESMKELPERAKVAFEIMDFAKKIWPKDLVADMEKNPMTHIGSFFYGDANSIQEFVDAQVKNEEIDIESAQKRINAHKEKPKQTHSDKQAIKFDEDTITSAKKRIQEYKDALAKEQPTTNEFAGLSSKERNGVRFAEHLKKLIANVKASTTPIAEAFMKEKGITLDQYRALPEAEREKVDAEWRAFHEKFKSETPQQKANRELDALVASGDISRDGKKVTILTEKGGREAKRIHEELQNSKRTGIQKDEAGDTDRQGAPPDGEGDAIQSVIGESVPGSETAPVPDGRTRDDSGTEEQQGEPVVVDASKEQGSEDSGGNVPTDQAPTSEGGVPTDTPPPTDSVALDDADQDANLSGIKKALVPEDKVESTPIERRSTEDMLASAKADVDSGRINPKAIVDEISKGNARSLQPGEVAALVYYKSRLDQKSDALNQELIDAIGANDPETQVRTRLQLEALNSEIDNYHTMSLKTAYEQSLAFRLRQMLLDNEYNLASQILKYKAANNGVIPAEVEAKFKELDEQLKAANLRIKALEEDSAKLAAADAMKAIQEDLKRQRQNRIKSSQARKQKINKFFDNLKVKSDPNKLNNIFQVVGEGTYNGAIEAMRLAVLAGNDVATVIQAGIDYINEHYRGDDFNGADFEKEVRPGIEQIIPSDDDSLPSATINEDGKLRIPAKLIKEFAEDAENIEELTQRLHAVIKQDIPEITLREVRDAITRYGETKSLSKDDLDIKLREMKRIGRLISSLEDVQDQKRPKRSGLQRDKPTDEERRLMKQVKEAMKDLPVDEAEMERNWRTALDQVKARLENQIADLKNQIETGEKTPKKKGIEYDQEANELRAQRDQLKEIIQKMEGKPKMSDEQKIRMAITAVEKNIAELERRISAKDVSPSQKSSAPVTPELKALRDRRKQLAETYKQLQDELGITEQKRLDLHKKALQKAIDRFQERIKTGDFFPPKKKPVTPDAEATKLKLERDKIKMQFDALQEKVRLKNRPWPEKLWDGIVDVVNVPKSFKSALDWSAPFRQGAILTITNPKLGVQAFREMFQQTFSQNKADEWLLALRETDVYPLMKNAKLYLSEPTAKHSAKEEDFMSNLATKIPGYGKLLKGSERAYTGYLNKLRADVFTNGAEQLRLQGITPESNPDAYKALASFINNATGRGNLGQLERSAGILNGLLFSPRYLMSRLNLLWPPTYAKMPAPVRKMAIKSMIGWIGFNATILILANAAFDEVEVEWDPRSSDFGKMKIGNTRYDPWAGFSQVIRFFAQFASGQRKNTTSGEIVDLDGTKFPFQDRTDVVGGFTRSKLSPFVGSTWNLLKGENMIGEEATLKGELLQSVTPLYLQDMVEIYEEEGPTGLATTAIPALFGIGVQSYGVKTGIDEKIDPEDKVRSMNQKHKYSISEVDRRDLAKSMEQEVSDDLHTKFLDLKEREIKRLFDRYHFRLERITDRDIYEKSMDAIVREADRKAKHDIAREKGWDKEKFKEGNKFFLRNYVKRNGKVEVRKSLFGN